MPLYRTNSDRGLWRKYNREKPPQHFHKACYLQTNKNQPQVTYSQLDLASEGRPRSRAMSEGHQERPMTASGSLYSRESSVDSRSLGRDSALGPYMRGGANAPSVIDRPNPFHAPSASSEAADNVVQMFLMNMGGLNLDPRPPARIESNPPTTHHGGIAKTVISQLRQDFLDSAISAEDDGSEAAAPKLNKYLKPENRWPIHGGEIVTSDVVQTFAAPQMHHAEVVHVRQDSTSTDNSDQFGGGRQPRGCDSPFDDEQSQANASMFTHANGSVLVEERSLPLSRKRSMSKPTDLDEILRMQEENGGDALHEVFANDPFFEAPAPELPRRAPPTTVFGQLGSASAHEEAIYENSFSNCMMETTQEIDIDAALGYINDEDIENIEWPQGDHPMTTVQEPPEKVVADFIEQPALVNDNAKTKKKGLKFFGLGGKKKAKDLEVSYYIEEPQPEPEQQRPTDNGSSKPSLFKFKGKKPPPPQIDQDEDVPRNGDGQIPMIMEDHQSVEKPSLFKWTKKSPGAGQVAEEMMMEEDEPVATPASSNKRSFFKFKGNKKHNQPLEELPPQLVSDEDQPREAPAETPTSSAEKPGLFKFKGNKKHNHQPLEELPPLQQVYDRDPASSPPSKIEDRSLHDEKPSFFKFKGSNRKHHQDVSYPEEPQTPEPRDDREDDDEQREEQSPQLGPIREEKPSFFSFASGKQKRSSPAAKTEPENRKRLGGFFKAKPSMEQEKAPAQIGDLPPVDISHLVDEEEMDELADQQPMKQPQPIREELPPAVVPNRGAGRERKKSGGLSGFFSTSKMISQPRVTSKQENSLPRLTKHDNSFNRSNPRTRSLPPPRKQRPNNRSGGGLSDFFGVSPQPAPQNSEQKAARQFIEQPPDEAHHEPREARGEREEVQEFNKPTPEQLHREEEQEVAQAVEPTPEEEVQRQEGGEEEQEDDVPPPQQRREAPPPVRQRPPKSKSTGGLAGLFSTKHASRRPAEPPPSPPPPVAKQNNPRSNSMSSISSQRRRESKGLSSFFGASPLRKSDRKAARPPPHERALKESEKPHPAAMTRQEPPPRQATTLSKPEEESVDKIEVVQVVQPVESEIQQPLNRVPQPGRVTGRQSGRFRKQQGPPNAASTFRGPHEVPAPPTKQVTEQSLARDLFAEAVANRQTSRRGSVTSIQRPKEDDVIPPPDSEYDQAMSNYNSMPRLGRKQKQRPLADPETRSLGEARNRRGRGGDDCKMM